MAKSRLGKAREKVETRTRENAQLRRANAMLAADNAAYVQRLGEAHHRVEALLATIPALEHGVPADADADQESAE